MFQELLTRAQTSIDALLTRYMTRLAVAVPFFVALGFGTSAVNTMLTESYGSTRANLTIATFFALVGVISAIVIAASPAPTNDDIVEESGATPEIMNSSNIDQDVLVAALGPLAAPAVIRMLVRNLPVILVVLILAYLLFSERTSQDGTDQPQTGEMA